VGRSRASGAFPTTQSRRARSVGTVIGIDGDHFVQIDVDGEPATGVFRTGGAQTDEMIATRTGKVAREFFQGDHVLAAHGFFRKRKGFVFPLVLELLFSLSTVYWPQTSRRLTSRSIGQFAAAGPPLVGDDPEVTGHQVRLLVVAGQAEGAAGVVHPEQAGIVLLIVHIVAGGAFDPSVEQKVGCDGAA
jgi:hypothetical protein